MALCRQTAYLLIIKTAPKLSLSAKEGRAKKMTQNNAKTKYVGMKDIHHIYIIYTYISLCEIPLFNYDCSLGARQVSPWEGLFFISVLVDVEINRQLGEGKHTHGQNDKEGLGKQSAVRKHHTQRHPGACQDPQHELSADQTSP